jgi:CRISPR/Cas system-associated exonuclease Cas4 (RecB family)
MEGHWLNKMVRMPDQDPTTRELYIMLSSIIDTLKDMRENMSTRDFVNAKFAAFDVRMDRLESDVEESKEDVESVEDLLNRRLDTLEEQRQIDLKQMNQIKTTRVNLMIVAALSVVGNLIVLFISTLSGK